MTLFSRHWLRVINTHCCVFQLRKSNLAKLFNALLTGWKVNATMQLHASLTIIDSSSHASSGRSPVSLVHSSIASVLQFVCSGCVFPWAMDNMPTCTSVQPEDEFHYQTLSDMCYCQKAAGLVINFVHTDQMPQNALSDLRLHCLLRLYVRKRNVNTVMPDFYH